MDNSKKSSLISFENKIAQLFNSGKIRFPIHLSIGNEDELIKIFKSISSSDWIFSTWRSHYHCLLKGVPEDVIEEAILQGRSIALNFPKYRVFSSAIAGGQISHAVGTAFTIKSSGKKETVWCFIGDMSSETGSAQSAITYAENFDLPIIFVIEDNSTSVLTNTREVWGSQKLRYEKTRSSKVVSYKYINTYPHSGAGMRVQF